MSITRATPLLRGLARLCFAAGVALVLVAPALADDAQPKVYALPTSGIVDQVMSGYIHDGIAKAYNEGASAALIELNTPGGDLTATRDIVTTMLNAPLPVIVWVGPSGARAASAGTFITLAGNIATMAPGTNIGAATPIDSSGQNIGTDLQAKVMQDTLALLRSISDARGRNYDAAATAVTDAASFTADEAVAAGIVDGIANTPADAVAFANGRTVTVNGQPVTLALDNAEILDVAMNPLQSLLHLLSDPNIAFVLFTLGFYGLIFELVHPNFVTGIIGGISIILAFIGFGSLPLNLAGILLIGLGVIMFVLELTITSHGLLTVAGIVCLVLGAAALYTEPGSPTAPNVSVAWPIIALMAGLTAVFMFTAAFVAVRARRHHKTAPGLVGAGLPADALAEVRRPLTPIGSVYAGGEEWTARSADEETVGRGTQVRVVGQDGLTLIVESIEGNVAPHGAT
jgi:membrane-bound serine protease (ClpP class)